MREKNVNITQVFEPKEFQIYLKKYVQLELDGQDADAAYPEVALLIDIFDECQEAYYEEFHRQGQSRSVADLKNLGNHEAVEHEMSQILPSENWYEVTLADGIAWLEEGTNAWRRFLPSLSNFQIPGESPVAIGGYLSGEDKQEAEQRSEEGRTLHFSPEKANFEMKVQVQPDLSVTQKNFCLLNITVTLLDRLGDFSGVQISLIWNGNLLTKITDSLGKVQFSKFPCDQLFSMNLVVTLPE